MKSLRFMHSAHADDNPGVPPKLKPFNALTAKLSSITWKGALSVAAIVAVFGMAPDAMAARTLRPGLASPEVAKLQSALGIHVDGLYGPQTASAVAAYQRACGLLVDGIAGPQTLSTLYSGACAPGGYVVSSYSTPSYSSSYSSSSQDPFFLPPGSFDNSYVVVIPGNDEDTLARVREICPGAFLDSIDRIPFVNAGEYDSFEEAARITDRLIGIGFQDARVAYRGY
ncbi:MAG: hypothetical protein Kow00121_55220 [Elainellaceae cyanobacterium]